MVVPAVAVDEFVVDECVVVAAISSSSPVVPAAAAVVVPSSSYFVVADNGSIPRGSYSMFWHHVSCSFDCTDDVFVLYYSHHFFHRRMYYCVVVTVSGDWWRCSSNLVDDVTREVSIPVNDVAS